MGHTIQFMRCLAKIVLLVTIVLMPVGVLLFAGSSAVIDALDEPGSRLPGVLHVIR